MNKEINNIIKALSGNVLGIGLSEEASKQIEKNEKIIECNLLNSYSKKKFTGIKKGKTIKIKKIRKVFKKKKVDYIICNYTEISNYLNTFIKDSIYINKSKLYFFGEVGEDLIKKYRRYNTNISIHKFESNSIVEIDTTLAKNNFFKDQFYRIFDWFSKAIEVIGDILMG